MNSLNSIISTHQKGQHLAFQDCVIIQALLAKTHFINYVEQHFFKQGWLLGSGLNQDIFTWAETVCTKTLYHHYVERGLLRVKTTNLPEYKSQDESQRPNAGWGAA